MLFDPSDGRWKAWRSTGVATSYLADDMRMGIKYAESEDGVIWAVQTSLALAPPDSLDAWDASKCETPTVAYVPDNPPERRRSSLRWRWSRPGPPWPSVVTI